jgi:hypothetical protein
MQTEPKRTHKGQGAERVHRQSLTRQHGFLEGRALLTLARNNSPLTRREERNNGFGEK